MFGVFAHPNLLIHVRSNIFIGVHFVKSLEIFSNRMVQETNEMAFILVLHHL